MRVTRLALCGACVVILACTPAKQPRAPEPEAVSPPRGGTASEVRHEARGDAPKEGEHLNRAPGTIPQSRNSARFDRDASTAAIAAENAARGPAAERPMWSDPGGIEIGAAASDVRKKVKTLVAPHDGRRPKKSPAAAGSHPATESPPENGAGTDGR